MSTSSDPSRHLLAVSRRRLAALLVTLVASWRTRVGGPVRPVPAAGPGQSDRRGWRSAWRRLVVGPVAPDQPLLASARQLSRLVVDAWPVLVRGYLPDLADQRPVCQERTPGHPAWCSQDCWPPSRAGDGTVEWCHDQRTDVEHLDGVADVFLVRMDALRGGEHDVTKAVVLTANGSINEDQAEAYALSILRAVRQLDAGLEGTPGGVPAALAQLPEPWPPPGRNRAL
jgi:hypothetical protein